MIASSVTPAGGASEWLLKTVGLALMSVTMFSLAGCHSAGLKRNVAAIPPVATDGPREGLVASTSQPFSTSPQRSTPPQPNLSPTDRSAPTDHWPVAANDTSGRSFNTSLRQRLRGLAAPQTPTKLASLRNVSQPANAADVADAARPSLIQPVAFQGESNRSPDGVAGSGSRIQADDALFYDPINQSQSPSNADDRDDGRDDGRGENSDRGDNDSDRSDRDRSDRDGQDASDRSTTDRRSFESSTSSSDDSLQGSEIGNNDPANVLSLDQIIDSVVQCYPEIDVAIGEIEASQGEVLAQWGEFDSKISAHSISQPLGFYQTYRNGIEIDRPLYGGGKVFGGYRIGDGNFEPWYGERETNEAGEFKAGFDVPLLRDRDIDNRRGNLQAANLKQSQIEANIEARLLLIERAAIQSYWDWVASGQVVVIQRKLLELAEMRVDQIELRIQQGDLAKIAEIDNDRFIAKRKNSLIKAIRGLEKSAIKLSLFYRDAACSPILASEDQLPNLFPTSQRLSEEALQEGIGIALRTRPELVELEALRQEAVVKLQLANNLLLPKLDVKGSASQDIGGETSSLGDKTPFKLELGVFYEVPVQQRKGFGKIQIAQGKIAQIDAKRQLKSDKIRAEIQDAASAVNAAFDLIRQSRENVRLNEQSLELGRLAFEEGDIDLLDLNIYESSVADARLQLLEAQFKYFFSLAIYQTKTQSEAFSGIQR